MEMDFDKSLKNEKSHGVPQFYTGNFLPSAGESEAPLKGKGGALYRLHGGMCLETQLPPDAVNRAGNGFDPWRRAVTRPGRTYRHDVLYRLKADD